MISVLLCTLKTFEMHNLVWCQLWKEQLLYSFISADDEVTMGLIRHRQQFRDMDTAVVSLVILHICIANVTFTPMNSRLDRSVSLDCFAFKYRSKVDVSLHCANIPGCLGFGFVDVQSMGHHCMTCFCPLGTANIHDIGLQSTLSYRDVEIFRKSVFCSYMIILKYAYFSLNLEMQFAIVVVCNIIITMCYHYHHYHNRRCYYNDYVDDGGFNVSRSLN